MQYRTSKPVVNSTGLVVCLVDTADLMAFGIPNLDAVLCANQPFEWNGVLFEPVEPLLLTQRSTILTDISYAATIAVIAFAFLALGWWGRGRVLSLGDVTPRVVAQPTCDPATGICK